MNNKQRAINIIDFDHTIYDGDATLDLYLYCLKKKPSTIRYLPWQLLTAVLFIIKLRSRTQFKSAFLIFLREFRNTPSLVNGFWGEHYAKIKPWYIDRIRSHDVIVSASPEFLLSPVAEKLQVSGLIATVADPQTGKISGQNCRGLEKVKRIHQAYGRVKINEAYSDSLVDLPILNLAIQGYIVKGNELIKFKPNDSIL